MTLRIQLFRHILFHALLFLSLMTQASQLPELGNPASQALSVFDEKKLGDAFMRAIRAQAQIIDDELINDYLQNLGQRLASNSPEISQDFNFFMLENPAINAFAGPNANIGLNSGLFLATENESQFASVIAHEIAHVSQKHLVRAFQSNQNTGLTTLATVLAAILVSSADPNAGAAILFGGLAGNLQSQINFTRQNEHEADRIGIQIMEKTNINPHGMVEFFEILQSKGFYGSVNDIEYLRTHPLNSTRIAEASDRISISNLSTPKNSNDYELAKARLAVLLSNEPASLYETYKNSDLSRQANQYALGYALIKLDKYNESIGIFKKLNQKTPHVWYVLALADAYQKNSQNDQALKLLEQYYYLYPTYTPVIHAYANELIRQEKAEAAIKILQKQLKNRENRVTYKQLAQAYFMNNQQIDAFITTANQYAFEGYYELAIQQIENAIKVTSVTDEMKNRLNARIEILKNKFKQTR